MIDDISGYYNDDGSKINPELVPKPELCGTCKKDDAGEEEEILCILTLSDQMGEKNFECAAYELKV